MASALDPAAADADRVKRARGNARLAVIGGSALSTSALFAGLPRAVVHGITVYANDALVLVKRHHAAADEAYAPPHLVDHVAIWRALKVLNVTRAVGVCSVGALRPSLLPVGTLLVPDDWFAPHAQPAYASPDAHYKPELDAELRRVVLDALQGDDVLRARLFTQSAVYAQTHGPRFETPAEVRALARDADVVGMTAASEAGLACELGIAYAMMCMVDNVANGLTASAERTLASMEAFKAAQLANLALVERAVGCVIAQLQQQRPASLLKHVSAFAVQTLVRAGHVATVDGADRLIRHGVLAIDDGGCIVGVHAQDDCPPYAARDVVELPDCVLIPGLVNAHTHVGMTLLRGYGDDLRLSDWLVTRIWPAEAKLAAPGFVFDSTVLACREMLLSGTTCFAEMYFFPEATERVAVAAGMRAVVGRVVVDFPTPMAAGGEECLAMARKAIAAKPSSPLITYAVTPHAPYSVSEERMVASRQLARDNACVFTTHLHETSEEVVSSCCADHGSPFRHKSAHVSRPLANLDRLGVVDDGCLFAHMVHCNDADAALLARAGASVAHCATSNMKLASGFCPVAALVRAGVNVCLGTDSAASNNALDMLAEMKTACLVAKNVAGDATAVTAAMALRMATRNGAAALGLGHVIGSLEAGKRADVVAVQLGEDCQPVFDPVAALVYSASRGRVSHVWVDGVERVRAGRLAPGGPELGSAIEEWRRRLVAVKEELQQV